MPSIFLSFAKWIVLERMIQVIVAIVSNAIIARYLGVELFGEFQAVLSLVAVFSAASLFCSAEVVVPLYCDDKKKHSHLFAEVSVIRLILSAIVFFSFLGYLFLFSSFSNIALILAFGILIVEPFNSFAMYFQAEGKQYIISRARIFGCIAKVFVIILFVWCSLPIYYLGFAYLFEFLTVALIFSIFYFQEKSCLFKVPELSNLKKIFMHSVWIGSGLFCMVLFQKSDRLILEYLNLNEELGLYSASIQIAENWFQLGVVLTSAIAAKLVYSVKNHRANKNISYMLWGIMALVSVATFFAYLLSDVVIVLLYGNEFSEASDYLKLLVSISFIVFFDSVLSLRMLKDKKSILFFVKWLFAVMLSFTYFIYAHYFFDLSFNPVTYLVFGYSSAAVFSFVYFLYSGKHEKNIVNM